MRAAPTVLLSLIALSFSVSAAKFYKWQDENGVTHYSAVAPSQTVTSETINTRTGEHKPSTNNDAEKDDSTNRDITDNSHSDSTNTTDKTEQTNPKSSKPEDPKTEKLTKQEAAKAQKQQQENCEILRKNYETLNDRPRVRVNDPDTGELRYLTPEEQLSMKEGAQEQIKKSCD